VAGGETVELIEVGFMRRFSFFILIAIVSMSPGVLFAQTESSATAQAVATMSVDDLPDSVLHGDLLAVVVLDLKGGDRTAWFNAVSVITGGRPTTRPLGPGDPLPMGMEQALGPIFNMGAERLVYVVSLRNGNADLAFGFRLADGTSDEAANAWLRKTLPANPKFEHDGAWLIKRVSQQSGTQPPVLPLSPYADDVRRELNCWGDDVPVKVVYLSSEGVKKQVMRGGPPPEELAGIVNLYWKARYLYIGCKLGAQPQVEGRWVAPDADGADAVIKELAATIQRLKQPNNGPGIPTAIVTAFDQLKPVREGNIVRVQLGQKELSSIFAAVIAASMNNSQNGGQQGAQQSPVAADWAPTDAAVDSTSAQMRLILAAIIEYDREHQSLPGSLADLVTDKLVPGAEVFHDPRTGKDDGFVYVKPDGVMKLSDIADGKKMGILFEGKDGEADRAGLVGYADGHVGMGK
jgi:hypothetical protein